MPSSFPSSRLNSLPSSPSLANSSPLQQQQQQSTPLRPSGVLSRNPSSTSTPTPLQNSFLPPSSPSNSTDPGTPQPSTPAAAGPGLSWEDLEGVRNQVESLRMLVQGQERRLVRREGESLERIRRVSLRRVDLSFSSRLCRRRV